ncbi:MAG: ATP-dependent RNA helicase HrpA, partial [Pseudomonadales bacterium]|nr:ATP-dependent RNA helicase HrpA [Pseudomonadales bacterium]
MEANCLIRDQFALKKQLARIRKSSKNTVEKVEENTPDTREITRWLEHYHRSAGQVVARKNTVPDIRLNTSLPVAEKAQEIREMLLAHQVLVIAGETGSGKTTQLPQICLQAGRGMRGMIGHTQPRRLAATTVASRIAEEMRVIPGVQVGYQIRFHDRSDDEKTLIKLMTHGILLAEIQQDRFLNKYDTLIIDEAHERSLNIDFLLGYLKYLLPKRPELKVIVTSATIDLERFSRHFDNAPVIEVSGRSFPVEVFYRPSCEDDEADKSLQQQIVETVEHCLEMDARRVRPGQGDILVFLSGEREIRETAIALKKAKQYSSSLRDTEILPLYARLSSVEQSKVFRVQRGRRIVLATNVAETSLTVPGIRYVIDPGYARISRYNYKTQIQRLPIEAISQASANQRKGRCGRVQDGVCFRLYSEDDFLQRAPFTEPEILRTNLASVILQMNALGLGNIKQFPFVESPDSSLVRDGYKLLEELNAIDKKGALTKTGRLLVRLPVDPRYAAMLIHAAKTEALSELLIIVSALSIQDPRERPQEKQQVADQQHRQWRDEKSDFIAFLNLWNDFEQQRQVLSQNQLRKWCSKNFLSYMRMREWRDLHFQLKLACQHAGFRVNNTLASYEAVHTALCAGLLSHI